MAKLIIKLINARRRRRQRRPGRRAAACRSRSSRTSTSRSRSAIYPGGRPVGADLDRRQGGVGHRQHEVRDERRAHDRHARRRQRRDPRGGRRRELLPLRADRRRGARRASARATGRADVYRAQRRSCARRVDLLAHGTLLARRRARSSARSSTRCSTATSTCCSPTSRSYVDCQDAVGAGVSPTRSAGRADVDPQRRAQRQVLVGPGDPRVLRGHLARVTSARGAGRRLRVA